jgi:hypothetical protein
MLEIGNRERKDLLNICIYTHVRDQELILKWWE